MLHPIPPLYDGRSESESHAIDDPFACSPARVETAGAGRDEPGNGAQWVVPIQAYQLGEIIARADRDDAQGGVPAAAEQSVRHFMHGAVAADRHDMLGSLQHGLRRELLRVTGTLGADEIHRPSLRPERARHGRLDTACRASSSRGIENNMGLKHAADKIPSRLPRKGTCELAAEAIARDSGRPNRP